MLSKATPTWQSTLMNGTILRWNPEYSLTLPTPERTRIQLVPDKEIAIRRDPSRRLPRQSQFYFQLVDHILNVKDRPESGRSLQAHFGRLSRYHENFIGTVLVVPPEDASSLCEGGSRAFRQPTRPNDDGLPTYTAKHPR